METTIKGRTYTFDEMDLDAMVAAGLLKPKILYHIGQRFVIKSNEYILACVGKQTTDEEACYRVMLININSGRALNGGGLVQDCNDISEKKLKTIANCYSFSLKES